MMGGPAVYPITLTSNGLHPTSLIANALELLLLILFDRFLLSMQIAIALGFCLLLVLISVVYFRLGRTVTFRKRVAASAHALLVAAILPYGLLVDVVTRGNADTMAQLPIFLLLVLAAASMVYSVWALRGRPLLHLAHLVTIALAIPLTFLGAIAIVGWT
jgi:hypothetical protein